MTKIMNYQLQNQMTNGDDKLEVESDDMNQ